MIEKANAWVDEVYQYITETYHAQLFAEKPRVIFHDETLDSSYIPADISEVDRKSLRDEYEIELPKAKSVILLPSEMGVIAGLLQSANNRSVHDLQVVLTRNYDFYIYSRIWHEGFHDFICSLPLDLHQRIMSGYLINDIAEFLPVAYTFFGIISGYEKRLAQKVEAEEAFRTQRQFYLLPRDWERYSIAMHTFFHEDSQLDELEKLLQQDKTQETKQKIERRAKEILKEFHGVEIK
jgi:hypothetical protein